MSRRRKTSPPNSEDVVVCPIDFLEIELMTYRFRKQRELMGSLQVFYLGMRSASSNHP